MWSTIGVKQKASAVHTARPFREEAVECGQGGFSIPWIAEVPCASCQARQMCMSIAPNAILDLQCFKQGERHARPPDESCLVAPLRPLPIEASVDGHTTSDSASDRSAFVDL